jgi:Ca-activated chloride channel family protein
MSFAWPWCFLLLPLPWLLRRWWPPAEYAVALHLPALPAIQTFPRLTAHVPWGLLLAWLLLLTAAARPQTLVENIQFAQRGSDMMLALDVSASMATADLELAGKAVQRLHAARILAGNFLHERRGSRVGLIVFGRQAYLHTPLTFDLDAVRDALASVETGLAGNETALGDAIALGVKHLKTLPGNDRVLVLLTDGSNTAGTLEPLRAAWLAQREGVRIHALGIGSSAALQEGEKGSVSALDERALQGVSARTGGLYLRATDSAAIESFFKQLDQAERAMPTAAGKRAMREHYPWPLAGAVLLVCLLLLRRRRGSRA